MSSFKIVHTATVGYRILHYSRIVEAGTVLQHKSDLLGLAFILCNDLQYKMKTIPAGNICRHHYNLGYLPIETPCKFTVRHTGEYSVLILQFTQAYLSTFIDEFPRLKRFLVNVNLPLIYSPAHLPITTPAMGLISYILSHKYTEVKHDIPLDEKVLALTTYCLRNMESISPFLTLSHPQLDIDRITKVHDHLLENLETSCSISVLASEFNMEARRLEKGFKLCYGTTVYDFHLIERMKKAKLLLCNTTNTVKDIAKKVGYRSVSSFSLVFKLKYGVAPRNIRGVQRTR